MEEKKTFIEIPLDFSFLEKGSRDSEIISEVMGCRQTARELIGEERYIDALERIVEGLRVMREFSDFENVEFRGLLVTLLFDLSEVHFALKDFKQSEKELEVLFRVLEGVIKEDAERFGKYHVLAMELSTRILRSRKKTLDLLVKQQLNAEALYDKVNSGVLAATDRLVDSLRNVGDLLASTGDYRGAMKFYTEAIRISKKRAGRVNRKEVKMTVEMAKIMMRVRNMRPRAKRLLNAILPYAIALETIELEEDILALIQMIDDDFEHETGWKTFFHKIQKGVKGLGKKIGKEKRDKDAEENAEESESNKDMTEETGEAEKNEAPVPEGKKLKKKKK
ncbi:MAG: hypothetical protein K2H76_05685 [Muribaculaceae bacterium]|nr:hypothetical protein [Muribaculaceae bacterium]MDE6027751.1 hypothetical protein [Muribaculaceae bacterium]